MFFILVTSVALTRRNDATTVKDYIICNLTLRIFFPCSVAKLADGLVPLIFTGACRHLYPMSVRFHTAFLKGEPGLHPPQYFKSAIGHFRSS